jgi:hypothetical protein
VNAPSGALPEGMEAELLRTTAQIKKPGTVHCGSCERVRRVPGLRLLGWSLRPVRRAKAVLKMTASITMAPRR